MNFEFFAFILFMSLSSFALAFIAYILITKALGKEGNASRYAQIILIPAIIVLFDMFVFACPPDYQYFVGALPMAGVIGLFLYSTLYKGKNASAEVEPQKVMPIRNEEKKLSKKSARIHAARAKRGRD